MNNDFQTLVDFLERCGPEVVGHIVSTPRTEDAAKLMRFASGQSNDRERSEVCTLLRMHPAWLRWLADRVKLARDLQQQGSMQESSQ